MVLLQMPLSFCVHTPPLATNPPQSHVKFKSLMIGSQEKRKQTRTEYKQTRIKCKQTRNCQKIFPPCSGPVKRTSHSFVRMMDTLRVGQIFCIASWEVNGCTHDTSKTTSEVILKEKICSLFDLFVLNSLPVFVNNVVQRIILQERNES